MARLSDAAVSEGLTALPGWSRVDDPGGPASAGPATIAKAFERPSFADAVAFVVRIGFLAEQADHHPDLDVRWRTVTVALSTHSEGGLTGKDLDLARAIEEVA